MTGENAGSAREWVDPDEAPGWTDEMRERAEVRIGDRVIRPATGTLTRDTLSPGFLMPRPGRPPLGEAPKQQVTLRLDRDVIERFRAGGKGWQSRINAALRAAVGL